MELPRRQSEISIVLLLYNQKFLVYLKQLIPSKSKRLIINWHNNCILIKTPVRMLNKNLPNLTSIFLLISVPMKSCPTSKNVKSTIRLGQHNNLRLVIMAQEASVKRIYLINLGDFKVIMELVLVVSRIF